MKWISKFYKEKIKGTSYSHKIRIKESTAIIAVTVIAVLLALIIL